MKTLEQFRESVAENVSFFLKTMDENYLAPALELIINANDHGGRIHITGIGKPSHVSQYGASLMSSIAVPAYFLDGTEAVHGSCGQLREGDVVICISNSGETMEMRATVNAVANNGCRIIGISRSPQSWLAQHSDVHLTVHAEQEGGPMNRAPISSVLMECIVLQALSVQLQDHYGLTPQLYIRRHPGGTLGKLREHEKGE